MHVYGIDYGFCLCPLSKHAKIKNIWDEVSIFQKYKMYSVYNPRLYEYLYLKMGNLRRENPHCFHVTYKLSCSFV